jgi:K+-transporting ATPase ATPase C chain
MLKHLRANLWLLGLTLLLCSVLYPLVLLGIGQTFFPRQAEGSLLLKDGKPVGSRLIAQPFSKDEYFQPRPSAVSYKADASGASNWGASNYLLRDRVARQLGPIVRYRASKPHQGDRVGPDVEKWFAAKPPEIVAEWADKHDGVAQAWVNADDKHKAAVTKWLEEHPKAVKDWKDKNPTSGDPKPADLAGEFFKSNAVAFHQAWPKLIDDPTWSVQGVFFDMWRQEHAQVELEEVPADMVMASGSGLDPHITLKNALYQLDRVAGAWAKKTNKSKDQMTEEIKKLLEEKAEAPLGGLVGVPLINVLEMNLALASHFGAK